MRLINEVTLRQSNSVALAIEKAADLHELAISFDSVLEHRRLHQICIIAALHSYNSLFAAIDEHVWLRLHELPHSLVDLDLGFLERS